MDDLTLRANISDDTTVYVSPIDCETYHEYIHDDTLGGSDGYFVLRSRKSITGPSLEVLAKAPSFDAAGEIFDMIVGAFAMKST